MQSGPRQRCNSPICLRCNGEKMARLGWADKTVESGPGWTARIRGDLTSVCKIFRWTDVWRGRESKAASSSQPIEAQIICGGKSLAKSPARVPKTSRRRVESLCSERRRKRWSVKKSAVEISKPQAKFLVPCDNAAFALKLPGITFRLPHRGSLTARRCCWPICNFSPSHF